MPEDTQAQGVGEGQVIRELDAAEARGHRSMNVANGLKTAMFLSLGGVGGTLLRYAVGHWFQRPGSTFPWGTLIVNLTGSFVLGLLMGTIVANGKDAPTLRLVVAVGFCGAFTTMSTFSFETISYVQSGEVWRASLYVGSTLIGALVAMTLGLWVGKT